MRAPQHIPEDTPDSADGANNQIANNMVQNRQEATEESIHEDKSLIAALVGDAAELFRGSQELHVLWEELTGL